jgi:hypothetical protein
LKSFEECEKLANSIMDLRENIELNKSIIDFISSPLPIGAVGLPTVREYETSIRISDPFDNPIGLNTCQIVKYRHDKQANTASILIQKKLKDVSDSWDIGLIVFRGVRSFSCSGPEDKFLSWAIGETPVIPLPDGYVFRLNDFPPFEKSLRVEFETAELYCGLVSLAENASDIAATDSKVAVEAVDWDSQIEVTAMSNLDAIEQKESRRDSTEFAFDDFYDDFDGIPLRPPRYDWYVSHEGALKCGPCSWRVLDSQDDKVLLISKNILALHKYDSFSNNWENSELRSWMNQELLDQFGNEFKEAIIPVKNADTGTEDKVFLLSVEEAWQYFDSINDKQATFRGRPYWWWLRSPGMTRKSSGFPHVPCVFPKGDINDYGNCVDRDYIGVRPALWLDAKSEICKTAETFLLTEMNYLVYEWDPVDLGDMVPHDEYCLECRMIFNTLSKESSVSELAARIHAVFTQTFDDVFERPLEDCYPLAESIIEARDDPYWG